MSQIEALISQLSHIKQGWKTSEFWVALVPSVVAILGVFGVHLSTDATTQLVTIVAGSIAAVYVAGRAFLKAAHVKHVANLAGYIKEIEANATQFFLQNQQAQIPADGQSSYVPTEVASVQAASTQVQEPLVSNS